MSSTVSATEPHDNGADNLQLIEPTQTGELNRLQGLRIRDKMDA